METKIKNPGPTNPTLMWPVVISGTSFGLLISLITMVLVVQNQSVWLAIWISVLGYIFMHSFMMFFLNLTKAFLHALVKEKVK